MIYRPGKVLEIYEILRSCCKTFHHLNFAVCECRVNMLTGQSDDIGLFIGLSYWRHFTYNYVYILNPLIPLTSRVIRKITTFIDKIFMAGLNEQAVTYSSGTPSSQSDKQM